ncbi:DUF6221 family protein [Embleya sp. NPDC056575]|uniref:DUF6221 family protein n=1 Tax=unclassified Embleya TaxID=2699296 RepID=UPI0036CCC2CF
MTDDLVAFLTARLDEDEAETLAASPGPWSTTAEEDEVLAADGERVADAFALSGRQLRATTRHIARHHPARVLRDVAARRALVAALAGADPHGAYITGTYTVEDALRHLAAVYSDHPDYQEAWRS